MKKVTQILSVFVVVFIFLLQCFYFVNLTVADTAVNLKKGKALIVVNYDKEKVLYTSLVEREQNFDFQIEIVSLQEKKVPRGDAKKIKEFLWDQKDRYKFFVLDEEIKTYQINKDEFYSDYFYAHDDGFFAYDERAAIKWGDTLRRYPGLILSRVKRSQIEYYAKEKNRLESNSFSLDLPFFAFNRDQPSCGVGNYQTDLSYIGWFLKTKFQKLDATIKITTLFDSLSSDTHPKYKIGFPPRKKPDLPLTKENFEAIEGKQNMFFLFNTGEPLFSERYVAASREYFFTSLWKDKNRDGSAEESEIQPIQIKKFEELNGAKIFSFYFLPSPYVIDNVNCPLLITSMFDLGDDASPSVLDYALREDPEGSNVATVWNAILTEIISGKSFAEANLLGYTNYFTVLRDKGDEESQALFATRLFFFGLPWYNIKDLTKQPEIKLEKTQYQVIGNKIEISIQNIGDKDLIVKVKEEKNTEFVTSIIVKPEETKGLVIKKKTSQMFNLGTYRLPRKSNVMVNLMTNDTKHPNIQLKIEFWE